MKLSQCLQTTTATRSVETPFSHRRGSNDLFLVLFTYPLALFLENGLCWLCSGPTPPPLRLLIPTVAHSISPLVSLRFSCREKSSGSYIPSSALPSVVGFDIAVWRPGPGCYTKKYQRGNMVRMRNGSYSSPKALRVTR
jgi:hypothetical protein